MEFLSELLSWIIVAGITGLICLLPVFIIYKLIKRLIRYNAEYKNRYEEYQKAKQDIDDIEQDLYNHNDEF